MAMHLCDKKKHSVLMFGACARSNVWSCCVIFEIAMLSGMLLE